SPGNVSEKTEERERGACKEQGSAFESWHGSVAKLVSHRVHQVIHAEFQRGSSITQRQFASIEPFPEFAQIVVIVNHHYQTAVIVFHPQKFHGARTVRRPHTETINLIKRIEHRMFDV